MFRSDVAQRERFDGAYPMTADLDLWVRLAGSYAAAYVPLPLLCWHWWQGNETHSATASGQFLIDVIGITHRLLDDDSLLSVRTDMAVAAKRRVESHCRQLLMSPGLAPKPEQYAAVRDALRGQRSPTARVTCIVLKHEVLLRLTLACGSLLRGSRRLLSKSASLVPKSSPKASQAPDS